MRSITASSAGARPPAVPLAPRAHLTHRQVLLFIRPSGLHAGRENGAGSSDQQQQESATDDPVEAMLRVARDEMEMKVVWADPEEDEEDYLDAMEDLEDVWMRNPSPPEWAEVTGLLSDEAAAISTPAGHDSSSSAAEQPGRSITTISWQELQQRLQDTQQGVVVLEVTHAAEDPVQQQFRSLPDPLPWAQGSSSSNSSDGHSTSGSSSPLQHVQLPLQDVTREVASSWQDKSLIAVLDTGHHSCLAAAIRLTAVYRLPQVVLLQL